MRSSSLRLALCAALSLGAYAVAQPPAYEVRTYTGPTLTNLDPTNPAAGTENTLKEPWICPYCGYSTGGTWDTIGPAAGAPPFDANTNGIPDEAEGVCPDPWNTPGHPANVALVPADTIERFLDYRWLGALGAPLLTLVRGLPFKPGDVDPATVGGATNTLSQVRAGFAFDPGNAGLPAFQLGATPTQVRFLLIPPGVARPTARYHSLTWTANPGGAVGADYWGADPTPAIASGLFRIGVHPWRAVDGDVYTIRCRALSGTNDVDIEVWSQANGLEYSGTFNSTQGLRQAYCASGAVRLDIPADLMVWQDYTQPPPGTAPNWWAFQFKICNNCRIMPNTGDDGTPPTNPAWLTSPQTPPLGGMGPDPANYFVAQALAGSGGSRGAVLDTDGVGSPAGPPLSPATAVEFRLRPGETGTGMVAVLWRNDPTDMWSYDEDSAPSPSAGNPEPPHPNGIQPVAARFFSTRIDTGNVTVDIPGGPPGGPTDVGVVSGGGDLQIANRQVGEIVRCPVYVPNVAGRAMPPPNELFLDPWWYGNGANGGIVGRGPGGDPPTDPATGNPINQNGSPTSPTRTIGCGAVHFINPTVACWCGRIHNPANPETMYCNYCGTRLLCTGTEVDDVERAAARVDVAPALATASHQATPDPSRTDAVYTLAAEAVRGTKDGVMAPGATFVAGGNPALLRVVASPLFVSIPAFQLPSYAPGGGIFGNGAPQPYQGAFVGYRTADEDCPWHEDPATGAHEPYPIPTTAYLKAAILDRNGKWDAFYRCPDCGNKHPALALRPLGGATPYAYTDNWSTAAWATDLECSYGHPAGAAPAPNNSALECPGHQICPTCGVAWEVQGEGQSATELQTMTLTVCPFDGTPLVSAETQQTRFMPDYLTAEEYDPLLIQAHVMRKTRLAGGRRTADLGRLAPGLSGAITFPGEVSAPVLAQVENQSNYRVSGAALLTQGVTAVNAIGAGARMITTTTGETPVLVRADADPTAENRSAQRVARSMPVTGQRLFASVPASPPAAADWATAFAPRAQGAAAGEAAAAVLQAGVAGLPVPNAVGSGNYSGAALAFVDTDGNAALSFLDRSKGLVPTNSMLTPFDPTEDYPLEPVVPISLRLRVSETRLPGNDAAGSDSSPAPLFADTDNDGLHDSLNLVWESNRPAVELTTPEAAVNLVETASTSAEMLQPGGMPPLGPGVARDYQWDTPPVAVTSDVAPNTVNASPEVYLDPGAALRWLLWHKLTPTNAGVASTLWSATAPGDLSATFAAAGTANYIFDSSLDKSSIRGFIDPTATAPANHWSFWNSGKRGKEEIHYCGPYNPRDPNTVSDTVLPISNGVSPSAKADWVDLNGTWIRKPPKSPFTYTKDPAPVMEMDPVSGVWTLHAFFSGYVPQEGNADIGYAKFSMGSLSDASANYGKVPHARIEGPYGGEEFRADGPRQTFGSRHLDWVTSRRRPRETADADFMRLVASGVDPQFFIHLAFPSTTGANHEIYQVTWAQETAPTDQLPHRYNRAEGVYHLGGLTFTRVLGTTFAPTITPVEPRTGRPLEMYVDPAAGLVRFSAPLFNPTDPADPATFFNSGNFAGLADVQLWANYTPFIYRLCRNDAGDDTPSAFFDYGDPNLQSPVATPVERASLGRFVVFWRRSHGASEPPHFGRTSFMYKTFTTAVEVGHPPIGTLTGVTDVTVGSPVPVAPIGVDSAAGVIGLPAAVGGVSLAGHRVQVAYDSLPDGAGFTEYHTIPAWSEEKPVNVDTVYSEGPLVVKREWYAASMTDSGGNTATQYLPRYWLFWTSRRARYEYDAPTTTGQFYQSRDVYYATVVPEYGTSVTEINLPSH